MSVLSLCAREFAATHPVDAARVIEKQDTASAMPFLNGLPADTLAAVLEKMSAGAAAEVLALLDSDQVAATALAMPLDSVSVLLRRLDSERRSVILNSLKEDVRNQLIRLLEYSHGTVGSLTDPEVLAIPDDLTVEEAQKLVRRRKAMFHHQLYVVDRAKRLLGYIHVRDLVRSPGKEPVASVMRPPSVQIRAGASLASSLSHPAWHQMDAIPVVDTTGVLLGVLRHRQLRRLQSSRSSGALADTLFGLSELYWMGLSTLMLPAATRGTGSAPGPRSVNGAGHGN